MDLPDSIKNIIVKQTIGSDNCDNLTKNGKECGNKFMYSINEYLFSKEKIKDIMVDCTKFCLKHLSDLAINGELMLGYEKKGEYKGEKKRKVKKIIKESVYIEGIKDDKEKIVLRFMFGDELDFGFNRINFYFSEDVIDDIKEFKKNMILKEKGNITRSLSETKQEDGKIQYDAEFDGFLISKRWRKFIHDCFKYEDLDYINLIVQGVTKDRKVMNNINSVLTLGNLDSIDVTSMEMGNQGIDDDYVFVTGNKIIQR